MLATDRAREIFADARAMQAAAVERLAAGDIRDAAEKAWCAVKRATVALILARTGSEPTVSPEITKGITVMPADKEFRSLRQRYFARQSQLHGACFYLGWCDPADEIERRIRETADYIRDAEALA